MELRNWDQLEIKRTEQLPKNARHLGYFYSAQENWDGDTWVRNFYELRMRDLALFALGDVKDKKILDIGCGPGVYLDAIARMGGFISGQDISVEYVNMALKDLKENGFDAEIKVGDVKKLLFDDNYFDGVLAADIFEHLTLEHKVQVVSEVYRVLRPGGVFVIKTPNLDYLKLSLLLKRILAILKFRSPFSIYHAHTHNNPDNQHCGLTTYLELEKILFNNMFHYPEITYILLERKKLPKIIAKYLYGKKTFTDQIIISTRKPLFYGLYL